MSDRIAFQRAINANPRDRAPQLVYADWLDERADPQAGYWRCQGGEDRLVGPVGRVGLGRVGRVGCVGLGLVGRVGRVGLGLGLVGRVRLVGSVGRVGLVGRVGRVGLVGVGLVGVGLVGCVGLVGLVGLGGLGGPFNPEAPIVLIPGENAMVFLTDGYYTSVLIGHVAQELPHGWIVDPCWEVLSIGDEDTLIDLAAGKKRGVRGRCKLSPRIEEGFRVPFGCPSIKWFGELPPSQ